MSIEAMKQALEALEILARYENPETKIQVRKPKDGGPIVTMYPHKVATDAADAIRTAIEQAEKQEPSYYGLTNDHLWMSVSKEQYDKLKPAFRMACYTTPPAAQPAPVRELVLQEIEQYRLQMAGISTAAIGYWKEGDGIHPDYDTPALRDVAKLYAKYDALYTAAQSAPVQEPVAWVDVHDYTKLYYRKPAQVDVVPLYYGYTTPPAAQRQQLTDEQIIDCWEKSTGKKLPSTGPSIRQLMAHTRAIEAAHGIKNNT